MLHVSPVCKAWQPQAIRLNGYDQRTTIHQIVASSLQFPVNCWQSESAHNGLSILT